MDKRPEESQTEIATLGGGCFWCIEPIFKDLSGVIRVVSGYAGGSVSHPSYHQVCSGTTGHAEVVQVTFNPDVISFGDILDVFFSIHDPTTPNRQGADVGPQYRSIILYHTEEQKKTAQRRIEELGAARHGQAPVVTEVVPIKVFYEAEAYHQDYFKNNPQHPYCRVVIEPKVEKFRKRFSSKLRSE